MRIDGQKLLSPFAVIMATVTAVTALLALMKLAGVIAASWLWVLSPIWGVLALIALAGLGAFLFVLIMLSFADEHPVPGDQDDVR